MDVEEDDDKREEKNDGQMKKDKKRQGKRKRSRLYHRKDGLNHLKRHRRRKARILRRGDALYIGPSEQETPCTIKRGSFVRR